MATYTEELNLLQIQQLEHDERFPKEITNLNIHQRLVHMILHFAKYTGRIVECIVEKKEIESVQVIDMFIICLATANILNIRISDYITNVDSNRSLQSTCKFFKPLTKDRVICQLTGNVSKCAKALESLDHLEAFSYREELNKGLKNLILTLLGIASELSIDFVSDVPLRLNVIKNRSIFKNKLKTHEERLRDYGYAYGSYIGKCCHCKEDMHNVDKRASSCKDCAEGLLKAEDY